MNRYQSAIELADRQQTCLNSASKEYARFLSIDDSSCSCVSRPAERNYWDLLAQPGNQKIIQSVNSQTYLEDWKKTIRMAAEEAYRRACPAMTARQMEAYAQGLKKIAIWEDDKHE